MIRKVKHFALHMMVILFEFLCDFLCKKFKIDPVLFSTDCCIDEVIEDE